MGLADYNDGFRADRGNLAFGIQHSRGTTVQATSGQFALESLIPLGTIVQRYRLSVNGSIGGPLGRRCLSSLTNHETNLLVAKDKGLTP